MPSASSVPSSDDLISQCVGTPHHIGSSSSGTISLSLSLQEDVIFLACPLTSPASYAEHEDRPAVPDTGSTVPSYDPLNDNFPDQSPSSINNTFMAQRTTSHNSQSARPMTPRQSLHHSSLGSSSTASDLPPSVLRGSLLMKLNKPTKIKDISVCFYGKCKTEWLDSDLGYVIAADTGAAIQTAGPQFQDEVIISSHRWEYRPAGTDSTAKVKNSIVTNGAASTVTTDLYGADVAHITPLPNLQLLPMCTAVPGEISFKTADDVSDAGTTSSTPFFSPGYFTDPDKQPTPAPTPASENSDGCLYPAGDYIFHFNLAIDARTADTVVTPRGAIKYYVVAKVERPCTRFLQQLQLMGGSCVTGHKEVTLVRSPPSSCEMISNGPLAISKDWEESLHYEISCSKKYIPLGSAIPLSIKLTPIAKVRVHRVRVTVTESVTYISAQRSRLQHKEATRKVLLYQKCADACSAGERCNGHGKTKKKGKLAMMAGNLLHFIEDPEPSSGAGTGAKDQEFETQTIPDTTFLDVTLPFVTSENDWTSQAKHHFAALPADSKYFQFLRPDATFNPFIHVSHRLQISFRVSRLDLAAEAKAKAGQPHKWRYFEVLIDTPIYFLSRHCKSESVELPRYADLAWQAERTDGAGEMDVDMNDEEGEERQAADTSQAIPIHASRSNDSDHSSRRGFANTIGSPLVRVLSSPFTSTSPPLEGLNRGLGLDEDPLAGQLPSFEDALSDRLVGLSAAAGVRRPLHRQQEPQAQEQRGSATQMASVASMLTGSSGTVTQNGSPPQYETIDRGRSSEEAQNMGLLNWDLDGNGVSVLPTVKVPPRAKDDDGDEEMDMGYEESGMSGFTRFDLHGAQL